MNITNSRKVCTYKHTIYRHIWYIASSRMCRTMRRMRNLCTCPSRTELRISLGKITWISKRTEPSSWLTAERFTTYVCMYVLPAARHAPLPALKCNSWLIVVVCVAPVKWIAWNSQSSSSLLLNQCTVQSICESIDRPIDVYGIAQLDYASQ